MQPLRRMGVDAAILFSDIMVPLAAVASPSASSPGGVPSWTSLSAPKRTSPGCDPLDPDEDVPHVLEPIRLIRKELGVPLLGFGERRSPWRATWSKAVRRARIERTKALMLGEPVAGPPSWMRSSRSCCRICVHKPRPARRHCRSSTRGSGARTRHLRAYRCCRTCACCSTALADRTSRPFTSASERASSFPGCDRRAATSSASIGGRRSTRAGIGAGHDVGMQGNLDPAVLLAPWDVVAGSRTRAPIARRRRDGHIFNLGHGVPARHRSGVLAATRGSGPRTHGARGDRP